MWKDRNYYKGKSVIGLLLLLLLIPGILAAQNEEGFGSFEEWEEGTEIGEKGSAGRFRLKGEWSPGDSITTRMELLYEQNSGMSNGMAWPRV
jgi:hypothetical protein